MADISCDIVVIGAGVLGLSVAAELTARGRMSGLVDPGLPNASSVAAGMIAPAFESLLDGVGAERAALLRDAAALWPAFAARAGIVLDQTPAEWRGADAEQVAGTLTALGFKIERGGALRAPGDVRIDAGTGLQRLREGLAAPVVAAEARAIRRAGDGWRIETPDGAISASQAVMATGTASALPGLPADAAAIVDAVRPIAGQIGRVSEPRTDRVLRGREGYVAPVEGGALIGATMVLGSRDATPDPESSTRLETAAAGLLEGKTVGEIEWRGGVRGATADGLPLAGPVGDGLHLALAPRRNGWLLGPLVGRVVADGIEGRPRGSHAAALDPLRFSPQSF